MPTDLNTIGVTAAHIDQMRAIAAKAGADSDEANIAVNQIDVWLQPIQGIELREALLSLRPQLLEIGKRRRDESLAILGDVALYVALGVGVPIPPVVP